MSNSVETLECSPEVRARKGRSKSQTDKNHSSKSDNEKARQYQAIQAIGFAWGHAQSVSQSLLLPPLLSGHEFFKKAKSSPLKMSSEAAPDPKQGKERLSPDKKHENSRLRKEDEAVGPRSKGSQSRKLNDVQPNVAFRQQLLMGGKGLEINGRIY